MKKMLIIGFTFLFVWISCKGRNTSGASSEVTITLGAYTVPKEAYEKDIIPAFQKQWLEKTGQSVRFVASYIASGAQSRAISSGFEADIAALSLEKDVERLREAGLITHDWKNKRFGGFVTRSVVVIAYRAGNPRNIRSWGDLAVEGVQVLYPNPKTSGGAMWDVAAIYGAALKMSEDEQGVQDKNFAYQLLKAIQRNVKVMDKSGRASVTTFENGTGDALVTYENEVLLRVKQGREMDYIIPEATILIENPVAVIDKNVDKHQNRRVVEAFVDFVLSPDSQKAFVSYGFRPVDSEVAAGIQAKYPTPRLQFDISYLGGWDSVQTEIFGADGIWTKILEELAHD